MKEAQYVLPSQEKREKREKREKGRKEKRPEDSLFRPLKKIGVGKCLTNCSL